MKISKRNLKKQIKRIELLPAKKQVILYLIVFLINFIIGSLLGSILKAREISRLQALRQELYRTHQMRLESLLNRFEAQASFENQNIDNVDHQNF